MKKRFRESGVREKGETLRDGSLCIRMTVSAKGDGIHDGTILKRKRKFSKGVCGSSAGSSAEGG
jgi:hypothetical protein